MLYMPSEPICSDKLKLIGSPFFLHPLQKSCLQSYNLQKLQFLTINLLSSSENLRYSTVQFKLDVTVKWNTWHKLSKLQLPQKASTYLGYGPLSFGSLMENLL